MDHLKYCNSLTKYSRFKTRVVNIGDLPLGGDYPIRIQSMTTTPTMDTAATVKQCIAIAESGADYVRITAPNVKAAENLKFIKQQFRDAGYSLPLIADIHFTPNAAEMAARIVEKVRINPGNFIDKKKFETIEYTDDEYSSELQRIYDGFTPLLNICKTYGTALRIGTNHGSLSDRIMSRYGDTPHGMVESAMEFLRIAEAESFHQIVLSMKASNPKVMIEAYRLLVNKMMSENMNYPLHLGVTEAGDGEDGRIKSALGIGTLLEDGLGDTIRVSLTEAPEMESPVAKILVDRYANRSHHSPIPDLLENAFNPFNSSPFVTTSTLDFGGGSIPKVLIVAKHNFICPVDFSAYGFEYHKGTQSWKENDISADYIVLQTKDLPQHYPNKLKWIVPASEWKNYNNNDVFPLFEFNKIESAIFFHPKQNFVHVSTSEVYQETFKSTLNRVPNTVLILHTGNAHAMADMRRAILQLRELSINSPLILNFNSSNELESFRLFMATDAGGLFSDGFGSGIFLEDDSIPTEHILTTSFGILQAARVRITKTDYIACPSCGRTLFDLLDTTESIRNKTKHLKGLKIGIMGCIVNGPGEMADADYGYVGSGPGVISLYKGQTVVKKSIPEKEAVLELIQLIKDGNDWIEPQ
jgi:(E)-4-hydroxy-3-methylbut-2-enyl-diphosphate synthase